MDDFYSQREREKKALLAVVTDIERRCVRPGKEGRGSPNDPKTSKNAPAISLSCCCYSFDHNDPERRSSSLFSAPSVEA